MFTDFKYPLGRPQLRLYQTLGVKHEALTLITPEFETPLPQLRAAVYAPVLKEI